MKQSVLIYLFLIVSITLVVSCGRPETINQPEPAQTSTRTISGEPVKVGVLAIRSAVAANAQYGPILSYLEEEIGRPFELVPVTQEDQFVQVEQETIDFTLNNPLAAVQIQRLYKTDFLATFARRNTGPEFSALIIASAESDIKTIDDLYGKRATCVNFETAAAGCVFQIFHLVQNGFDPFEDFASFTETPSQDNIVLGVLNNTFDVGFIRTGQVEKMVSEGTLTNIDEIRIIDQADDDFFFPHTTRLYPEWPFAALVGTDSDLAQSVKEALLSLPEDHPALEDAKAVGFVPAVDYTPLHELIEVLQLRSYDAE